MQNEAGGIQRHLISNLVSTSETVTKLEKENFSFVKDLEEKNAYKHNIKGQINEIQHLIRILNYEISQ